MGSTNIELDSLAKELNIPNYVNARMIDQLIGKTIGEYECGIINLENSNQNVSHWLMYYLTSALRSTPALNIAYISYKDPLLNELIKYLSKNIYTSSTQIQDFDSKACGYYCLAILFLLSNGVKFEDIILGFKTGFSK